MEREGVNWFLEAHGTRSALDKKNERASFGGFMGSVPSVPRFYPPRKLGAPSKSSSRGEELLGGIARTRINELCIRARLQSCRKPTHKNLENKVRTSEPTSLGR